MNHLGDTNKMVSDTPRTDAAYAASTGVGIYELFKEAQDIERELNAANERIRLLIAERDTARRQADQNYKLRDEFTEMLGTDDVEQGVAVVREIKERISKLNDYVAALETAGELMANELSYGYDVDMWNKAKEAKP